MTNEKYTSSIFIMMWASFGWCLGLAGVVVVRLVVMVMYISILLSPTQPPHTHTPSPPPIPQPNSSHSDSYLVDPASSHMLVSKIKPCMSKYKLYYTVKLRMAHYISDSFLDGDCTTRIPVVILELIRAYNGTYIFMCCVFIRYITNDFW